MKQNSIVLISLIFLLIIISCSQQQQIEEKKSEAVLDTAVKIKPSEVNSMKVLFIIAQDGFRDEELDVPKKVIEQNGISVDIASITTDTATGKLGMTLTPDLAVKDADLEEYVMITVIGGPGAPALADYPEVMNLLKEAKDKDMFIGAICIAPTILAKAGILQGKKATVWNSVLDKSPVKILEDNGATYVDEPVVVDGKIITGNGPGAAEEFGRGIVDMLNN
ncbi:DJ-1/PfpI family protein [Candidatus Woesearchaeota archaeon]|nr:DJ-1/PfpI family protein [Candidatus Woesearchaeota archaeon]